MNAPKFLSVGSTELGYGVMLDGGLEIEPTGFGRDEVIEFGGEVYVYELKKIYRAVPSPDANKIPVISV